MKHLLLLLLEVLQLFFRCLIAQIRIFGQTLQGELTLTLMKITFSSIHSLVSVCVLCFWCDTAHRCLRFLLHPTSCLRLRRGGSCCRWLCSHTRCNRSRSCCMSSGTGSGSLLQRRLSGKPVSHQVCCQTATLSKFLQLCIQKGNQEEGSRLFEVQSGHLDDTFHLFILIPVCNPVLLEFRQFSFNDMLLKIPSIYCNNITSYTSLKRLIWFSMNSKVLISFLYHSCIYMYIFSSYLFRNQWKSEDRCWC